MPQTTPPGAADEMTQLTAFLTVQRDVLRHKTADLDAAQLDTRLPPSTMTLGGLVKHLAYVEDYWLGQRLAGGPPVAPWDRAPWEQDEDWDWHSAAGEDRDALLALWETSVQRAEAALEGKSPDDTAATTTRDGTAMNVRFVLLHLIAEYARHAGHADLLREAVDGSTGD